MTRWLFWSFGRSRNFSQMAYRVSSEGTLCGATPEDSFPPRLYSVDVMRGLASLCVVVWHWQHFGYSTAVDPSVLARSEQPFYPFLSIAYEYGHFGVELFFVISGFVFFWLYANKVHKRYVTSLQFSVVRFSRLYPLHVFSLVLVTVLQSLYFERHQSYFIYMKNDGYHFFLHAVFANGWGFERGYSFNGPAWSVSVEVLLYVIFFCFALCGLNLKRTIFLVVGSVGISLLSWRLGSAALCFFVGGVAYFVTHKLRGKGSMWGLLCAITAIFFLNFLVFVFEPADIIVSVISGNIPNAPSNLQAIIYRLNFLWIVFGVFLPLIVCVSSLELKRGPLGRSFAWVGDISYSTYLLHFPLQIIFVMSFGYALPKFAIYNSNPAFLLYFACLIVCSLVAYHSFERPAQRLIRMRFTQPLVHKNDS